MNFDLRKYREILGVTQQDLAKAIGKSFRTVQSWERGESYPNAEYVWRLCEFFGTDPNTLLGWYEEHPREDAPDLSRDERELVGCYRESTQQRKSAMMMAARDYAAMSKDTGREAGSRDMSEAV